MLPNLPYIQEFNQNPIAHGENDGEIGATHRYVYEELCKLC
jgi:hypothetical protein